MEHICAKERFKRDIRDHRMTIIRDDDVHRHIQFKRPNTGAYSFDIITWPGHLAISGDCGSYTFARVRDMVDFFAGGNCDPYFINPSYWGEKLQSVDRDGGYKRFSGEKLAEIFKIWMDEHDFDDDEAKERLKAALDWSDWGRGVESYGDAIHAIDEISSEADYPGFQIDDLWDYNTEDFTRRYIWCVRAIRWAVTKYRLGGDPITRQLAHDQAVPSGRCRRIIVSQGEGR